MAISPASVKYLPEELIWEIVSRLPSKPLFRFRYVSRSWYDMISKLVLSRKTQRLAVLHSGSKRDARLIVVDEEDDEKEAKKIIEEDGIDLYAILQPNRGFPSRGPARILGSYGGLLLLILNSIEIFLLNPSTLQHKKVLESPIPIDDFLSAAGFCYDSVLDDYKVVIINPHPYVTAYIASFKSKTWKRIRVWYRVSGATTGTVVDEKIHWVVQSGGFLKIVAFHPAQDAFVDMPFPEHPDYGDQEPPSLHVLGVLDGCLALSSWKGPKNPTNIWVMKRYGVTSSWTNLFNIPRATDSILNRIERRLLRPLFFTKQGKLLLGLLLERDKLVEYDMERKSYRFIYLPDKKTQIGSVITFEEGLSFPHDAYFRCEEDRAAMPPTWKEASSKRGEKDGSIA